MARLPLLRVAAAALLLGLLPRTDGQTRPWKLHILSQAAADLFGAKCTDGSPPGFFWKPAADASAATKFKLHFRGGGWAFDATSAAGRIPSESGSSTHFPADPYNSTEAVYGLMDDNATNPFGDWNAVWAPYCDGSSWTGDREEPISVDVNGTATQVWLRGYRNLQAVLHELNVLAGFLDNATEVIITGTSAGGLATVLHSNYIKSQLKQPGNRLVAVPDAGWWWDTVNVDGQHAFAKGFIQAYGPSFWNATARALSPACLASYPPDQAYQCILTGGAYSTVLAGVDGVFVMQSLYDAYQVSSELGLPCNPYTTCTPAQLAIMQAFRSTFQANITTTQVQGYGGRDGHFLTACFQHEESCRDMDWYGITIGGLNANNTFSNWYYGTGGPTRVVDVLWPNNPTCQPQGVRHGGC